MLWALVIGLIVGAVAKFLMPGRDPGGIIVTIILGILGSLLAYWIGRSMNFYGEGEPVGFIAAVIGSMLVLFIYRMIKGRSARV